MFATKVTVKNGFKIARDIFNSKTLLSKGIRVCFLNILGMNFEYR